MNGTLLAELMQYCKVEVEASDFEVTGFLTPLFYSATALIEAQTGKAFSETPLTLPAAEARRQLYWLAIKMIVLHWYDNRGLVDSKTINSLPYNAQEIIKIIAMDGDYE